jgi:hypothetical protein
MSRQYPIHILPSEGRFQYIHKRRASKDTSLVSTIPTVGSNAPLQMPYLNIAIPHKITVIL